MTTVRLNCPPLVATPLLRDVLFAATGIESEIVEAATWETIVRGLRMPVAATGHLLAMKVLAERDLREHDVPDIARLLHAADESELHRAREALALITARGYNRGKDLLGAFEGFLRS